MRGGSSGGGGATIIMTYRDRLELLLAMSDEDLRTALEVAADWTVETRPREDGAVDWYYKHTPVEILQSTFTHWS